MVAVGHLNRRRDVGMKPLTQLKPVTVTADPLHDPIIMSGLVKSHNSDHNDPFALAQYNKAITLLSQRLTDPEVATEVALLACILFVCIEFLRGDVEPAFRVCR